MLPPNQWLPVLLTRKGWEFPSHQDTSIHTKATWAAGLKNRQDRNKEQNSPHTFRFSWFSCPFSCWIQADSLVRHKSFTWRKQGDHSTLTITTAAEIGHLCKTWCTNSIYFLIRMSTSHPLSQYWRAPSLLVIVAFICIVLHTVPPFHYMKANLSFQS